MTQPTPYNRQYNFTDYQSANPDDPLPGVQVDAEYNAIRVTLGQTLANLALIQRDDGRLANQSVGKDTLDPSALALIGLKGFTPKGAWAAATAYSVGDLVDFNDATYVALVTHTSGAVFDNDLAADKWLLIANAALLNNASAVDQFIGNGSQTVFTTTYSYSGNTAAKVYVNGLLRRPGSEYTISGTTVTFTSAPPAPATPGQNNIVVWGSTVEVQAAVQSALASASNAAGSATAAAASAAAALSSQNAAAASQTAAATSATNSANSATAAANSASTAATQATNSANSATASATSATNSANSAAASATSATNSASSATSSAASATLANDWATKTSSPVAGGEYSAKYHAQQAATSATSAANSASTATTQAGTATTQATNATNAANAAAASQTAAAGSASAAAGSATTASTQATNAANSASASATSATNSANSATASANSASAAATSATNAANSATAAAGSASTASTQATNAANSASAAATSASNAATSEANSAASAVSAAASSAAAAAALDNFDDRYLGAKTSDPAVDNDGNALITGALYFNSVDGVMKIYTGSGWIAASSATVATLATFEFVATAGQTVFTGADANGLTLSYVAPALSVTLNGLRLRPGDDYTATNGTSITLISAAAAGDELVVDAFGNFLVANTYTTAQADAKFVEKTSGTGAAILPAGTTAQRPASPVNGQIRYNADLGGFEGYKAGAWGGIGGGATGGGNNAVFFENDQVVSTDYTISAGKNAGSFGTITINNGVTVTIPNGSTWTIV